MICGPHGYLRCPECPPPIKENPMRCTPHGVKNCAQSACKRARDRRTTQDASSDNPLNQATYGDYSSGSSDCGPASSGYDSGSSSSSSDSSSSCSSE